jgi:glycosyltransferase involved in cell wall biosynthesis
MKICFITTGNINSLATMKRATGMAQTLIEKGFEVTIVALDCLDNRSRFQLECPDAQILYFQEGSAINELNQKKKIVKLLKPDFIYVCSIGFRNWIHKYNSGCSNCIVEHSELASSIQNNKKRVVYKLIEYLSLVLFNGQIYASRYLEQFFSKKNKSLKLKNKELYLPYAFNDEILSNYSPLLSLIEKDFAKKKVVLYMGTLSLNYGFLDILKAVDLLKKDRDDFIFLVMGSGRHKNIGETYVHENNLKDEVQFLGFVPEEDVSSYFKVADVFVSPLYDTVQDWARCPSKLFMYLPFEKPIVTCEIGEAKELFNKEGYYFSPDDVSSLTKTLNLALDSERLIYNVEPSRHTWKYRTNEFINWLEKF